MARRPSFDFKRRRLNEIGALVRHRHGRLPDTDDAEIYLEAVAWHLNPKGDVHFALATWARRVGAVLPIQVINEIVERTKPSRIRADPLGKVLMLTDAERTALRITTIGACDLSRAERNRRRKLRKRQAELTRRLARGGIPRAKYLAQALSHTKPWVSLGISRRTWERRRRKAAAVSQLTQLTQVRAQHSFSQGVHGLASAPLRQQSKAAKKGNVTITHLLLRGPSLAATEAKALMGATRAKRRRRPCQQ